MERFFLPFLFGCFFCCVGWGDWFFCFCSTSRIFLTIRSKNVQKTNLFGSSLCKSRSHFVFSGFGGTRTGGWFSSFLLVVATLVALSGIVLYFFFFFRVLLVGRYTNFCVFLCLFLSACFQLKFPFFFCHFFLFSQKIFR